MNKEVLYRFFEGTASLSEEKSVRQWLDASPENKKELLRERKIFDTMLLTPYEEKTSRSFHLFPRYAKKVLKAAALVGITLLLSTLYWTRKENRELQALQSITVPTGQRVNLTLPDGTSVWLNARTTLQYPLSFARDQRKVILNGEAYFEVTKNPKRPFVVETSRYDIEVRGTTFNVEAYAGVEEFETSLMSGKVRINNPARPEETIELHPKTKAFLRDGHLLVDSISDYNAYLWKEGLISFKDQPFDVIMNELEKCYGIQIQVKNKFLRKYRFTGKFRYADGVDYALRVLQKDIKFKYERDDEKQIIYIK